jgi:hypothetical protein
MKGDKRLRRCFSEVPETAKDTDATSPALKALSGVGGLHVPCGRPIRGAKLLGLATQHPATAADVKQNVLPAARDTDQNVSRIS